MRYGYRLAGGVARHNVEQSDLRASILDDVDERLELSDHVAEDKGWELKTFLCDPQKERLLEYDPDDPFYRNMFNRGLIDRDGLTELGRKAMEHYVASA